MKTKRDEDDGCMRLTKEEFKILDLIECHLGEKQYKILVNIVARVMERSYRRGAQQAAEGRGYDDCIVDEWCNWRYDNSLDTSYGLDGYKSASIDRLDMEEPYWLGVKYY